MGSDVAENDSQDERSALFSALAERLLGGESEDDPERRAHLIRLLASLMAEARETIRSDLARRIADMPSPPRDLALVLGRDRADIAAPILREVPFSPRELIELVTRTGPEHHIEIARRSDLELDIWLALARAAARRARVPVTDKPAASTKGAPRTAPEIEREPEPVVSAARPPSPDLPEPQRPSPSPPPPELPAAERRPAMPAQLEDPDDHSWAFETDRTGRIIRLSPNASRAFGSVAPSLVGESFVQILQIHAAVPAPDEVGEAMARHAPVRDAIIETMSAEASARRWRLRASPRFSFPDGRFEGYGGEVRDLDRPKDKPREALAPGDVLDRLARAAERLQASAGSPELADYAQAMIECIETLRTLPANGQRPTPRIVDTPPA